MSYTKGMALVIAFFLSVILPMCTTEATTPVTSFQVEGTITAADIVKKTLPQYPSWAKAKGLDKVSIRLGFSVDASGAVKSGKTEILTSSGYKVWDKEVKAAFNQWEFKPSDTKERNGRITFIFILQ